MPHERPLGGALLKSWCMDAPPTFPLETQGAPHLGGIEFCLQCLLAPRQGRRFVFPAVWCEGPTLHHRTSHLRHLSTALVISLVHEDVTEIVRIKVPRAEFDPTRCMGALGRGENSTRSGFRVVLMQLCERLRGGGDMRYSSCDNASARA